MNKKLLAVAIGSVLAGSISVAQADVQLFGQLDVSIDSHDCGSNGCPVLGYSQQSGFASHDNSNQMNMNGNFSYFGVKGAEDLGNGLKAIFNATFAFDVAGNGENNNLNDLFGNSSAYGGSNSIVDSEKWLGLAGSFGSVRAGTVFTPYIEHGEMIDPFFGTSLEGNKSGLQSPLLNNENTASDYAVTGLVNRTIRYDSPDFNGLSGNAFYTMGHGTNTNGDNQGSPYGIGGQYKNGNILAFADYLTANLDNNLFPNPAIGGGTIDDKAWDVGGQYTMGNIAFFGKYEGGGLQYLSHDSGASTWHLGGSFKMGNTLLYAAYGEGQPKYTNLDEKVKTWALGVKHDMSVRTSVYAGYINQKDDVNNADVKDDHVGLGMNVKF